MLNIPAASRASVSSFWTVRVQDCNVGQSDWPQQQSSIVSDIDISESLNTRSVAAVSVADDELKVVVVVVVANMLVVFNRLQRSMIRDHQEAGEHGWWKVWKKKELDGKRVRMVLENNEMWCSRDVFLSTPTPFPFLCVMTKRARRHTHDHTVMEKLCSLHEKRENDPSCASIYPCVTW